MTETLILENDLFCRRLVIDEGGIYTSSIYNKITNREYNKKTETGEFQFNINSDQIVSYSKPQVHILDGNVVDIKQILTVTGYEYSTGNKNSQILKISMYCVKYDFDLHVCYEIYSELAGCVKWLEIVSHSKDIHISKMFFEQLSICPGNFADSDFFLRQGMTSTVPMFTSSGEDDILQLYNAKLNEGFYICNTACGPLRYFMVYPNWDTGISCGYNMSGADFNKFLQQNGTFVSDKSYLLLYTGKKGNPVATNSLREMIRRNLPVCSDNGKVMYCTWLPFMKNINEELILNLVNDAAELGFYHFVLDDGWFTDNNWEVDSKKFPHGMKSIADAIHDAGMKFGLWLNVGNDYGQAGSRSEDNATDYNDEIKPFGFSTRGLKTRCFASKHSDIMAEKLINLVTEYNVDYFKLDFSNILSPYGIMSYGCHSQEHEYHRNYADSVFEQYQGMMSMRNKIKDLFPDIIIDFTFETFGMELPSIAAIRYSELNHVSNMHTLHPELMKADHIRRTLYEYCNLLPNERILGSLICLQDGKNDIENLLTSFIGTPLVAGDLTKIKGSTRQQIKNIVSSLNNLIKDGPLTEYQLLKYKAAGTIEQWDSFTRYAKTGSGIICAFRNDYPGRIADISMEDFPDGDFILTDMINGRRIQECSGADLRLGISITWEDEIPYRAIAISI